MKLIIEAGSTKTQSRLLDGQNVIVKSCDSAGINPVTDPNYTDALSELINLYRKYSIGEIYYYGSGCIGPAVNDQISGILQQQLCLDHTEVHDDLYGTARATAGDAPGLAVIMGTGSIIGYSDGTQITDKLASGGYLLGDEGSGFAIGRELMTRYIRSALPKDDMNIICDQIKIGTTSFIAQLYQQPNPRKYLASFTPLVNKIKPDTRSAILNKAFSTHVENMITPMYEKYGVSPHYVGSIAFYFRTYIEEILAKFDILAGSFHREAIDGLVQYHSHEKRN